MNANVSRFVVVRRVVIREHWAPEAAGSADKIRSGQRGAWQPWSCSVMSHSPACQEQVPLASLQLCTLPEGLGPFPGRAWAVKDGNHKQK